MEADKVWQFMIAREIEAPERLQAIQSYRAAMAVLKKQVHFVHELFETGTVFPIFQNEMAPSYFFPSRVPTSL